MIGHLECSGITHLYRRREKQEPLLVLDNITLDIAAGSFVSLIGLSGCGKSTLLKIFAGLIEASIGEVRLDSHVTKGPHGERGMVFQQDAVFPWLSVIDNIAYGLKAKGVARREYLDKAHYWARQVGLEGFENAMPKELSGGMRKRVDVARVYANEPEVLLMDEPFGALDAQTKERMQADLVRLWEQDRRTVVFVTHDLDEALVLSDKVVAMSARPGRIQKIHQVDISRPRSAETKLSDEFLAVKRELYQLLGNENREVENVEDRDHRRRNTGATLYTGDPMP